MEHGTRFELANKDFAGLLLKPLGHPCTRCGEPKAGIEPARTELIPFSVLPGILGTTAPPWLASAYFAPVVGFAPTAFSRPSANTHFGFSRQSYYNKKPPLQARINRA